MSESRMKDDARHISPWTGKQNTARALWYVTYALLFRPSPRRAYGWRRMLLRAFGASIDRSARIRPSVRIEIPWNLRVGANTAIGDYAIIYNLGPIVLGRRVTISQYAHLCAGTHDHRKRDLPLQRPGICVDDDAWIAADGFVGPGVTVGEGAIVGARASAFSTIEPWTICVGNPAKPIKRRELDT